MRAKLRSRLSPKNNRWNKRCFLENKNLPGFSKGDGCRYVPMFGESEYDPTRAYTATPFEEQLQALNKAKEAGKIREFGLSNETAWGATKFCSSGAFFCP